MHSLAGPLSRLFSVYLKYQGAHWLIGLGLLWYGYFIGHENLSLAYPWWVAAGAVVCGYWIAEACGFAIFFAEPDAFPGPRTAVTARVSYGVAAGDFDTWNQFRFRHPMYIVGIQVQVRWMAAQKLPELAILSPYELEPTLHSPVESAEAASLWYEGSEVTRGRVFIGGQEYPGLRLRFLGRQMLLGLESEDDVAALVEALRSPA